MAVAPLFVSSMTELKKRLRLTGVPAGVDANSIIDDATLNARVLFNRMLGVTRVAALVAFSSVDNPATENEVMRATANLCEVRMVQRELARTLRMFFADGSGVAEQAWNQEGFLRDMAGVGADAFLARLDQQIANDLDYLAGATAGDEVTIQATAFEPDDAPPRPGDSIWANVDGTEVLSL